MPSTRNEKTVYDMRFVPLGRRSCSSSRLIFCIAAAIASTAAFGAQAESLQDALAAAYRANPNLQSARRGLGAVNEQVPQALSGWRPTVTIQGRVGREREDQETGTGSFDFDTDGNTTDGASGGTVEHRTPRSLTLQVRQPLYRGGSTLAGIDRAESAVKAERARVDATEQDVLFRAARAYMDVWRDKAVLHLNENNVKVLRRQLQATRDRFQVGEVTQTDVAQAESRLAEAIADRANAAGQLNTNRAVFQEVIRHMPGSLEKPPAPEDLPANLESAVAQARENNPNVRAAFRAYRQARHQTREIAGELLPQADLVGELRYSEEQFSPDDETQTAEIRAELTIPLYQQGQVFSRVREAKQTTGQRRRDLAAERNAAEQRAVDGWETLQSARAQINARQEQVRAADVALDGVEQEAEIGARTVLDALDAEQELLDAQVSLVRTRRDVVVASYDVLAAVGKLNAQTLGLPVKPFEVEQGYEAVRNKLLGWGLSEPLAQKGSGHDETRANE